jgi:CheY-like chemotaxis protein
VLIVEDQYLIAEYFKVVVEGLGYETCGMAATAEEAIYLTKEENPAIIFMDVRLAGERDGIDAALEIREFRSVPIVYVTASKEPQTMARMKQSDPAAILIKPVTLEDIQKVLSEVVPPAH